MPPPVQWVSATLAPGTCRGPAWPRNCQTASTICATPVAPTGWPPPTRPPLRLSGWGPPPAQAERLVIHDLGAGEGVVDLGDTDIPRPDAGGLVGEARGALGQFARRHVAEAGLIEARLEHRRLDLHRLGAEFPRALLAGHDRGR